MNNILVLLELNDGDKRALIITVIILTILICLIVALGALVRMIFNYQSGRADGLVSTAVRAGVIKSGKQEKAFGFKKNTRLLYKESLLPFLLSIIAVIELVIAGIATGNWGRNIFAEFGDLFFQFDFEAEGVIVNFWGLKLLAAFPPVSHQPEFVLEHLCSYIAVALFTASGIWYFVVCQGFLARHFRINHLARKNFGDNLENYNAREQIKIPARGPLPPED